MPVRPQDEPGARHLNVTLWGGGVEAAMDRRRRGAQALVRGSCALGRFTRQDASPGVPQDGSAREFTVLRRRRGAEGQAAPAGAPAGPQEQPDDGPGPGGEFQDIPEYECGGESGWTPQREPAPGGRPHTPPPKPPQPAHGPDTAPNQDQPRPHHAAAPPTAARPRPPQGAQNPPTGYSDTYI